MKSAATTSLGWRMATALATMAASGCSGESGTQGLTEPIRVRGAQFQQGSIPGSPPAPNATDGGTAAVGAHVTGINVQNRAIRQSESGMRITGLASTDAETVAVRFDDIGTGYWLVPVGAPDPQNSGELGWGITADFGSNLPVGFRHLLFAAIDKTGSSGQQLSLEVCTTAPYPDNLNACSPKTKPPATILSLVWDTNVDLDLRLVTPGGNVVGGKSFSTLSASDGGITDSALKGADVGILDRDSNGGCVLDGLRREDVSWQGKAPAGRYQVFVNLYDACGQASVRFKVILYLAESLPDGTWRLNEQPALGEGELLRSSANGGSDPGLFVTEFNLQ